MEGQIVDDAARLDYWDRLFHRRAVCRSHGWVLTRDPFAVQLPPVTPCPGCVQETRRQEMNK